MNKYLQRKLPHPDKLSIANHESSTRIANEANIHGKENVHQGSQIEMSKLDNVENSHSADTQQIRGQQLDSVVGSNQDNLKSQEVLAQNKNEQVNQQTNDQVALNEQASSGETASSKQIKEADQYLSALKTNEHVNKNTHRSSCSD